MDETRTAKEIAWKLPDISKRRGRPKRRWKEAVMEDIKEKGPGNCQTSAREEQKLPDLIMTSSSLHSSSTRLTLKVVAYLEDQFTALNINFGIEIAFFPPILLDVDPIQQKIPH
ncbi:hypothetical protein QE152_g26238 [Popillia japonica]|uniref:Uncharacterized protein n=1 Tax=Popillia japonica TaxID=7064 RepID=A0AAW1JZ76_POPJA